MSLAHGIELTTKKLLYIVNNLLYSKDWVDKDYYQDYIFRKNENEIVFLKIHHCKDDTYEEKMARE